jgi:hypothetical protein
VAFNRPLHDYLRNVRDKHVAHSVNDFESCKPVGLMIGMPGQAMRPGGIGFAGTQSIGIRREQVLEAIAHIAQLIDTLRAQISMGQERLFQQFKEKFEADGRWEPAPIASIPDGANVARRRPR